MKNKQVILVTGASSGFGKITALLLSEAGHVVYGTSRKTTENLDNVIMLKMDVTDKSSVSEGINRIIGEQGHIDVVINNAGIGIGGALELATSDEIDKQMNTNFRGMVNICQTVLPFMRKERNGKIINLSSIAGIIGVPYQGFYSASKFAIEGFSEALSLEVSRFNIHICLIEPGDFNTGFTANRQISTATLNNESYGKSFKKTMKIIEDCERNGANPDKVAKAVLRIVSQKNPSFRTLVGPAEQVWFARLHHLIPQRLKKLLLAKMYEIK